METLHIFLAVVPSSFLLLLGWRILNWVWLKPKKLEKRLKMLGLQGTPYKLLFGDVKEMVGLDKEAKSKPMSLNHDIVPRVAPFINEKLAEYGSNGYIWTGPTPTLLLMESELIKEVLNKNNTFLKPPFNPLLRLLADGIVSHEKEKWAKHRKLITPALQLERVKLMVPAFYASCCDVLSKWEKICPNEESFELDVWPYLQTLTSDAISRTAFGSNYEEGREIFQLQKELVQLIMEVMRSLYIPGWRFVPTKRNRKMKAIAKKLDSSIMEIISKRVNMVKAGESQNQDLLDILLESNSREIEERGDKKFGMSLHDVLEECKVFYFAGQETTSSLLVWTLLLLSIHPEWQDRAREEVRQVIGDRSKKPNFDEFNSLKVITMILNEVQRLYPPGAMLSRMTTEETELGNLVLPSGVQIFMPVLALHHDKKIWGEDANEFKPERFSEGVLKATKGQLAFIPFGWGPRICPGQNFSMLESKMALSMMLQNYSFELSPSYAHAPMKVITLQPQHGAPLILRRL